MALQAPPSQVEILKSLKASVWDGISWSLTVGFAEVFFSPFALFLGAAHILFGLYSTLPQLIGALSQILTPSLSSRIGSRKRLVLMGVSGQGFLLILMAFLPFLSGSRLGWLFLITSLYWMCWMILTPVWQSWMGELVPEFQRGRYFGARNRWIQVVTFLALIAGGWILNRFQSDTQRTYQGFLILFLLGALGRILSLIFLQRQNDLLPSPEENDPLSFRRFIKIMPRHSFGLFALYSALFSVAVNIAGPFFISYMLQERRFTYLEFMILLATMVASKFLFLPLWGRLSDRFGSQAPFKAACLLFSLIPFFWLFSSDFFYLLGVHFYSGIALAGFELSSFNFLLDGTEPKNRTRFTSYFESLVGVGTVLGAVIGGICLQSLPFSLNAYSTLFLVSGICRLLLSFLFLPRIQGLIR
jgi:MFS family permease